MDDAHQLEEDCVLLPLVWVTHQLSKTSLPRCDPKTELMLMLSQLGTGCREISRALASSGRMSLLYGRLASFSSS